VKGDSETTNPTARDSFLYGPDLQGFYKQSACRRRIYVEVSHHRWCIELAKSGDKSAAYGQYQQIIVTLFDWCFSIGEVADLNQKKQ
jgi:hypothetical protein